jgi:hypothetical protein
MRVFLILVVAVMLTTSAFGQNKAVSGLPPRQVVERLWVDATAGNLLNKAGLKRTSARYQLSAEYFQKPITVISNDWAVDDAKIEGDKASVLVGYFDLGKLDSKLRFKDVPDDPCASKNFFLAELEVRQTYTHIYGSDGKTLLEERPAYPVWQLKQPLGWRWTTVNTAIRYVMEMRAKTSDPEIKKNADKTIGTLLRYH